MSDKAAKIVVPIEDSQCGRMGGLAAVCHLIPAEHGCSDEACKEEHS